MPLRPTPADRPDDAIRREQRELERRTAEGGALPVQEVVEAKKEFEAFQPPTHPAPPPGLTTLEPLPRNRSLVSLDGAGNHLPLVHVPPAEVPLVPVAEGAAPPPAPFELSLREAAKFSPEVRDEVSKLLEARPGDLELRLIRSTLSSVNADPTLSRSKKNAKVLRALENLRPTLFAPRARRRRPPRPPPPPSTRSRRPRSGR